MNCMRQWLENDCADADVEEEDDEDDEYMDEEFFEAEEAAALVAAADDDGSETEDESEEDAESESEEVRESFVNLIFSYHPKKFIKFHEVKSEDSKANIIFLFHKVKVEDSKANYFLITIILSYIFIILTRNNKISRGKVGRF